MATDIYILGPCLVNDDEKLEPRGLKYTVKPDNNRSLLLSQSEIDADTAITIDVDRLADLHSILRKVLYVVTGLDKRMLVLEGEMTRLALHGVIQGTARIGANPATDHMEPDSSTATTNATNDKPETQVRNDVVVTDADAPEHVVAKRNEIVSSPDVGDKSDSPNVGFRFQGSASQRLQTPRQSTRPAPDAGMSPPILLSNRFSLWLKTSAALRHIQPSL